MEILRKMTLINRYEKCKSIGESVDFIYDFLFEDHVSEVGDIDPMDLLDVIIADRIYSVETGLSVDINTFDYRDEMFPRYNIPMVVVDGSKGCFYWNYLVPVSISNNPEILIPDELLQKRTNLTKNEWDDILEFISINHKVLYDLWFNTVDWDVGWNSIRYETT